MQTAKVFTSGRSQAVRIPKEFRFDTEEVFINRVGDAVILTPIQQLGRCNTPLTMMMIGMILCEIDVRHMVDRTILWFTLHRLVLMPLIVYLACLLLRLSREVTGVSVLLAAMPAGATTSMLASKYQRDPQFATRLVVFTTVAFCNFL